MSKYLMHGPDGLPVEYDDEWGDIAKRLKWVRFGKSSPRAPTPPDPAQTAAAQAAANKETAIAQQELNMINQYNPYENVRYEQIGVSASGTPQYSVTRTLAPEQQRMLDLTNQAGIGFGETANMQLGNVRNALSQPIDFSSLGARPEANEAMRQRVAESMLTRMSPLMERDRGRLETRLANQGITLGSDAWNKAMDEERRARTDARLAIDTQALGQMGQMYGLEQGARNAAINEMVQQRQIPLNELNAMLTQSQVQGPSFMPTPQSSIAAPDYQGAVYQNYQGQLANYNQQMQGRNAMMGGLFGLGSAGLMATSDRRLKKNIERVGQLANGLGAYLFEYVWGGPVWLGVMADEVKKIMPHAVVNVGGFDAVNYEEVLK